MVRCQRCRLDCAETDGPLDGGEGRSRASSDSRGRERCPVCRLERSSPDETLPPAVFRRARLVLGFETSSAVRSRLVNIVHPTATPESCGNVSALRVDSLRRIGAVLGVQSQTRLTARELRRHIVDDVGVDASPASKFRKETLVEVTVHVADVVSPPRRRPTDENGGGLDSPDEADLPQ